MTIENSWPALITSLTLTDCGPWKGPRSTPMANRRRRRPAAGLDPGWRCCGSAARRTAGSIATRPAMPMRDAARAAGERCTFASVRRVRTRASSKPVEPCAACVTSAQRSAQITLPGFNSLYPSVIKSAWRLHAVHVRRGWDRAEWRRLRCRGTVFDGGVRAVVVFPGARFWP